MRGWSTYSPEVPSHHPGLGSSLPLQWDYKAQAGASPGTWHWTATVPYTWTRWIWLSFWRTFQKLPGRDFRYKWVTHREPRSASEEQRHGFSYLTGSWVCQKEAATPSLTLLRASFYTAWASEQGWRRTKHVSSLSELNKYLFCSLTNILMFYSRHPKREEKKLIRVLVAHNKNNPCLLYTYVK